MFDWFAYAEKTAQRFIEQFADLDTGEHPDKAPEIAEACRLRVIRDGMAAYDSAVDEMAEEMRRFVLSNPGQQYDLDLLQALFPPVQMLDNFGIKAEDVKARIETLRGETSGVNNASG